MEEWIALADQRFLSKPPPTCRKRNTFFFFSVLFWLVIHNKAIMIKVDVFGTATRVLLIIVTIYPGPPDELLDLVLKLFLGRRLRRPREVPLVSPALGLIQWVERCTARDMVNLLSSQRSHNTLSTCHDVVDCLHSPLASFILGRTTDLTCERLEKIYLHIEIILIKSNSLWKS